MKCGRLRSSVCADEAQRKRWIESIDIAGNVAVGKIILDYPSGKFVDFMTLLKIDGEWKIVTKVSISSRNKNLRLNRANLPTAADLFTVSLV